MIHWLCIFIRYMEIKMLTVFTMENQMATLAIYHATWCLRSRWGMKRAGNSYCNVVFCLQRSPWRNQVPQSVSLTRTNPKINVKSTTLLFSNLPVEFYVASPSLFSAISDNGKFLFFAEQKVLLLSTWTFSVRKAVPAWWQWCYEVQNLMNWNVAHCSFYIAEDEISHNNELKMGNLILRTNGDCLTQEVKRDMGSAVAAGPPVSLCSVSAWRRVSHSLWILLVSLPLLLHPPFNGTS